MFVIVKDNIEVILGPMPWRKLFFQNILLEEEDVSVVLPQQNDVAYVVNERFKILPAQYTEDSHNPKIEQVNGPFWTFTADLAVGHFYKQNRQLDHVKNDLKATAASKRWAKEVGGVKVTVQGSEYTADTSREGRGVYLQALQLGSDGSSWKFPEGFIQLSLVELQAVVSAIVAHVQTCFEDEALKIIEIDSKTTLAELRPLFDVEEN
jgi:hypothetical protein